MKQRGLSGQNFESVPEIKGFSGAVSDRFRPYNRTADRQWQNPLKLNVLVTCSGCCGHETLLEHVITEASLMT